MANVLTSQTILDGERLAIIKVTGFIDTVETNVAKITPSSLNPYQAKACTGLKLNRVWAQTHGCEVQMLWDASTPVMIVTLPQNTNYALDYSTFGGIPNNAGAGKTGILSFTTMDVSVGDAYSVVMEVIKTYA